MVTLGMLAAPLGWMMPVNVVLGNVVGGSSKTNKSGQERKGMQPQATWDYALWAIETAGPSYIKLVQWAYTSNNIFTPESVKHQTLLQIIG